MAQSAKYIDITRTYLPIDPVTLPENSQDTSDEDAPEQKIPVVPYEGYNFMPTPFGYRSYFGASSQLNADDLPVRADDIILFQLADYSNLIIAFGEDGVYQKDPSTAGAWTKIITAAVATTDSAYLLWTWCVIENKLYIYRQAEAEVYTIDSAGTLDSYAPAGGVINMAGQIGIYKAGGRLGFWDSSDAHSWSSYIDREDFLPSITTLANVGVTFRQFIGKTTMVKACGKGFVIYGTRSILQVRQSTKGNSLLWDDPIVLSNSAGVSYWNQVAVANPDSVHFAWTNAGLARITEE
jgi:hypothetical protein